ncbi:MAG: aldolase [Betaproteobacteria bacterium]|nr:aldolase [Betaproteobacteria bacterium]
MIAYPNHTKCRLAEGKLAIGIGVRQARTIDIAAIGKTCGFDWLFINMEHGSLDLDTASAIACAALPLGITPLVRVPGKEHHHASRMLDNGAQGIVVPHVETVEEARTAVSNCRYPPQGSRSVAGAQPLFAFRGVPQSQSVSEVNEQTLVVLMLESPKGIENADAIAAAPGVDVLLIGTGDLSMEMGIPGQLTHPRIEEAYQKVIAACRAHGVHPGMGGIHEVALIEKYVRMGMRFVLGGNDLRFLMSAAQERARSLHGMLEA